MKLVRLVEVRLFYNLGVYVNFIFPLACYFILEAFCSKSEMLLIDELSNLPEDDI